MKRDKGLLSIVLTSVMVAASWSVAAEEDRSAVLDRIKPVGSVAVTGQPAPAAAKKAAAPAPVAEKKAEVAAAPAPAVAAPAPAPAAPAPAPTAAAPVAANGEAIYKKTCFICHAAGVAGAPKLDDKANWAPRIARGVDALVESSIKGTAKGMPPRGTCAACSDADLRAVVEYMVSQVP